MKRPLLFIISGPSGAGKTTLLKKLFRKKFIKDNCLLSISWTTRPKRPSERDGKDYFFTTKNIFEQEIRKKFFLEKQRVGDYYYGTPLSFVRQAGKEKKDLILCIDVKGAKYVQDNFKKGRTISIFVSVPMERELLKRLKKRKERNAVIGKRIALAKKELKYLKYYGYLIINQDLGESTENLEAIIKAERLKKR